MTVPLLFPRYREALAWAIELHGGVLRKAWPRPLVVHLIAVSSLVWEDDGDEDQAVGALLHDALVYGGCSLEAIEERFGARVAEIARDATDTRQAFDPGLRPPWLERRQTHINSIAMLRDHVLPVMAADKAQECLEWTLLLAQDPAVANRLPGGEVAPLAWYYNSLHHTLNQRLSGSRSLLILGHSVQVLCSCVPEMRGGSADQIQRWLHDYPRRHQPDRFA